jgi:hypothetical protein
MEKIKTMNIRLPFNDWKFLRQISTDKEISINKIICDRIMEMRKKHEKQLTQKDAVIP